MGIFHTRNTGVTPWIVMGLPYIFVKYPKGTEKLKDVEDNSAISLEIFVMLAQSQPNWALLLKVKDYYKSSKKSLQKTVNCY